MVNVTGDRILELINTLNKEYPLSCALNNGLMMNYSHKYLNYSLTHLEFEELLFIYNSFNCDLYQFNAYIKIYLDVFRECNLIEIDDVIPDIQHYFKKDHKGFEIPLFLTNRDRKPQSVGNYYAMHHVGIQLTFVIEKKLEKLGGFIQASFPYSKKSAFKVNLSQLSLSDFEDLVKQKAMMRVKELINNSKKMEISSVEFKSMSYEDMVYYSGLYSMMHI